MIKKIIQDKYIKKTGIFMVGSLLVAFLNYLYYPILGRLLPVSAFGELQALLAIFLQFSVLVYIFSLSIMQLASNEATLGENQAKINTAANIANWFTFFACMIYLFCIPFIKKYLNLDSYISLFALLPIFWLTARIGFFNAYQQGKQELNRLNIANAITSGGRLLFALLLIWSGWKIFGALAGLFLAQVFSYFYIGRGLRGRIKNKLSKMNFNSALKRELAYSALAFLAVSAITFFYSADVILVKHYFSAEAAGIYSGISTVARILYFLPGPIAGALLPAIKEKADKKDNQSLLLKSLLLTLAINTLVFLTFYCFYDSVIRFLLSGKYQSFAYLLPKLSILMFCVALVNILFYYQLALRRYILMPISLIGVIVTMTMNALNHSTIENIINNFLFGIATVFGLLFLNYVKTYFHHHARL